MSNWDFLTSQDSRKRIKAELNSRKLDGDYVVEDAFVDNLRVTEDSCDYQPNSILQLRIRGPSGVIALSIDQSDEVTIRDSQSSAPNPPTELMIPSREVQMMVDSREPASGLTYRELLLEKLESEGPSGRFIVESAILEGRLITLKIRGPKPAHGKTISYHWRG